MVDNHHLFGKSEIGTHSAVKNSTRGIAKSRSRLEAQQRPFEPKRRLLDFDESDEILDEEVELDAELSWLTIEKLSSCSILEAGEKNTSVLQPPALRQKEFSVGGASC